MYTSRCGVCCDQCQRKEAVSCTGCIAMKLPFWGGVCQVKSCCEKKQLPHCGVCPVFPCTMLETMGKDQGYDPTLRLEQCKKWAQETHKK